MTMVIMMLKIVYYDVSDYDFNEDDNDGGNDNNNNCW